MPVDDDHDSASFDIYYNPKHKTKHSNRMSLTNILMKHWKGRKEFLSAQGQVAVILLVAFVGNNWPKSYHRNENHNPPMFWVMNALLLVAAIATLKHDSNASSRGVQLLSRSQTEEWKGWMQWAFIMVCKSYICCLYYSLWGAC